MPIRWAMNAVAVTTRRELIAVELKKDPATVVAKNSGGKENS